VSDVQLVGLALVCLGVGWILGIYYGVSRERDAMNGALIRYADKYEDDTHIRVRNAPYDWSREGVL
jgi:hypothetical protein